MPKKRFFLNYYVAFGKNLVCEKRILYKRILHKDHQSASRKSYRNSSRVGIHEQNEVRAKPFLTWGVSAFSTFLPGAVELYPFYLPNKLYRGCYVNWWRCIIISLVFLHILAFIFHKNGFGGKINAQHLNYEKAGFQYLILIIVKIKIIYITGF